MQSDNENKFGVRGRIANQVLACGVIHTTAGTVLENVRALAPEISSRAEEIATLRRLPGDLVTKLKAAGAFSMSMPAAWGGPEMDPREQCEVYEVLGAADASVAWCVKIGTVGTTAVFSTKSPLDRLLRDAITMSQHLLLGDGFMEMIGAVMLGEPPPHLGIL